MKNDIEIYTGNGPVVMPAYEEDAKLDDPERYLPSEELKNAVNVAIYLGKPLLLTGEPGSGKTHLAHNLAHNFGFKKPLIFNTRTTSKATDLFYTYDAIKHFQYAQNKQQDVLTNEEIEEKFIRYNALGQAIMSEQRCVVLIDEIDKAPRDLPNDILNILEDLSFNIPEINKTYTAQKGKRPIIVLTSNSEKNLPDAFLRRCVYFHLPFPDDDSLLKIVCNRINSQIYNEDRLRDIVLPHFMRIRKNLPRKKPSTSELLQWVSLLEKLQFSHEKLEADTVLDEHERAVLEMSYNVLAKNEEDRKVLIASLATLQS